jgi:hypothetical protein
MSAVDADHLPALHGFVHGLRVDLPAVFAGPTLPYSNGPIEGANTKVKLLNGRCTAEPASPSYASASCSRRSTTPDHRFCARAVRLTVPEAATASAASS